MSPLPVEWHFIHGRAGYSYRRVTIRQTCIILKLLTNTDTGDFNMLFKKKKKEEIKGTPDCRFEKITDITPDDLKEIGAEAVAIDIDNTSTYNASLYIHSAVRKWVKMIRAAGYPVMIVTNTLNLRAKLISKELGNIPFYAEAHKPEPKGIFRASEKLGVPTDKIAMIGDKLSADILAANRSGAKGIKVKPMKRENVEVAISDFAMSVVSVASAVTSSGK